VTQPEPIRVFDSQGEDYKRAFQVFLDHTDQKRNAKRLLQGLVDDLPSRKVLIEAGAGNGDVTRAFAGAFDRTIAIEPNMHLLTQLQRAVPQAEAIGMSILATSPKAQGDFVLCSHTLYYIPAEEWLAHLERPSPGCRPPASPSSCSRTAAPLSTPRMWRPQSPPPLIPSPNSCSIFCQLANRQPGAT
jgi:hypothetical protein